MTKANPYYPIRQDSCWAFSLKPVSETWNAQAGPIQSGIPTVLYGSEDGVSSPRFPYEYR